MMNIAKKHTPGRKASVTVTSSKYGSKQFRKRSVAKLSLGISSSRYSIGLSRTLPLRITMDPGSLAPRNKSLAQMNKSRGLGKATKGCSALRVADISRNDGFRLGLSGEDYRVSRTRRDSGNE